MRGYFPSASTCRPSRRRTIQNSSTVSDISDSEYAAAAPWPVWAKSAQGELRYANSAYAKATEAASVADAIARNLELLESDQRDEVSHGETWSGVRRREFRAGKRRGGLERRNRNATATAAATAAARSTAAASAATTAGRGASAQARASATALTRLAVCSHFTGIWMPPLCVETSEP